MNLLTLAALFGIALAGAPDMGWFAGNPAPRSTPNGRRHSGAAAIKRAARKRRNVRARGAK